MINKLKPDNYLYTYTVTPEMVSKFNKEVSKYKGQFFGGNFQVIELKPSNKSFSELKRTVSQVYDFIKPYTSRIEIIFDGHNKFQLWFTLTSGMSLNELQKICRDKFNLSMFHNLFFENRAKALDLYSVHPRTGLVVSPVHRNYLSRFKKKNITLDKVYKKLTNKSFNRIKKAMDKEGLKKKIKDYFTFNHDQLDEMYRRVKKIYPLEDRMNDNFYRQVTEVYKKKHDK